MGSQLTQIFAALEAMPVSHNSALVDVRGLNDLPKGEIPSALCPVRLLLPVGTRTEARAITPISFGQAQMAQWKITDLLLLRPVPQGRGLQDAAAELVNYIASYTDALAMHRRIIRTATIEDATLEPGIFEYNGASYFGTEVILSVKELF